MTEEKMTEEKEFVGGTFEIRDDDINIKEIDRQIRENIIKRKKLGAYSTEMEELINRPLIPPPITEQVNEKSLNIDFRSHMNYIDSNWDIYADYKISSHRPIIGKILIWGRTLISNEVRRYVDILRTKQSEFNKHMTSILKDSDKRINLVDDKLNGIDSKVNDIDGRINSFGDMNIIFDNADKLEDINSKLNDIETRINGFGDANTKLNDIESRINSFVEANTKINDIETRLNDLTNNNKEIKIHDDTINYFLFEDKHRGKIDEIKNKQSIYLEYFKNCQNVVDIGCGRGEFLLLLRENGINGKGIDIDEDMILYCKKNNLNVEKMDALAYLQSLENKSLDGIFSSQVVEHLQSNELINLVKLCYDKMKYGTYIVIETINPSCLNAHITFYKDLSHVRLMPHETLKFILDSVGFREIDVKFLNIHSENLRLDRLDKLEHKLEDRKNNNIEVENDRKNNKEITNIEVESEKIMNMNIEKINSNIDKLNSLLFGYQDYAIVAKK